ncbi:MAG: hypothetical protein EPO51_06835 [Phenylobacterium sp.]|uniref:hypothetical protein n=1 Tax=Phenylobacterium sp. TaxID=1871053 RepID=UPI00121DE35D|nr:hypothetical protein [Phenylobacterium sp.]TAJ72844.1 MAG: hypothetical protein EPO51_06835 [Phenylobacterium sp.]
MAPIRCVLAGTLALLTGHGAQAGSTPSSAIVEAFRTICATDDPTPEATLARAESLGWRRAGPDAPPGFDPRSQRLAPAGAGGLVLGAQAETTTTVRVDSCGVSAPIPVGGLTEATEAWLGITPTFAMANSATFSAVWVDGALRPAAGLDRTQIQQAHREGRLYSVMVLDDETGASGKGRATLALLRLEPEPGP